MRTLGLGGLDHNLSAAVIDDGEVVFLHEAERVVRRKNVGLESADVLNALLDTTGLAGMDAIAVADGTFWHSLSDMALPVLRRRFAAAPVRTFRHHDCHMMAAMAAAPVDRATGLSIDGKGDGLSASSALLTRAGIERHVLSVPSAHSLGRLWWAVSEFCGMPGHYAAGKTMALAAYGQPAGIFDSHIMLNDDGTFHLDPGRHHADTFRSVPRLVAWIEGQVGRKAGTPDADVAASVQALTVRVVTHMARAAVQATGERTVCFAGGVALNGLANQALLSGGDVDALHVPACTDDRGLALGAAALLAGVLGRPLHRPDGSLSPFLGPQLTWAEPPPPWRPTGLSLDAVAARIGAGAVVAWCAGRDESGPRALGHRSILATPTSPNMREHMNQNVKRREAFRPFGCSVLAERVQDWFECEGESPYMLRIARAHLGVAWQIPAVLHVDGTSRLHTVRRNDDSGLTALLDALVRIGHPPLVLNTSLNGPGEPIASTIHQAASTAEALGLKLLIVEGNAYERD